MSGSKNYGTFTQWNSTQQKERNPPFFKKTEYCVCSNKMVRLYVKYKLHVLERCSIWFIRVGVHFQNTKQPKLL